MEAKMIVSTNVCCLNSFALSAALVNGTTQHHTSHLKGLFGQKGILLFFTNNKIIILLFHI